MKFQIILSHLKTLRLYFRNLARNKIFSLVSIGGFSISLAVVILLLAFVRGEKQYDRSIPDMDQIYRIIHSENGAFVPEKAREIIETKFPQVLAATNISTSVDPVIWNEHNNRINIIHTDNSFFKVFSTTFIRGVRENVFEDPYRAVLTRSCAKRIFGEIDPIGEILNVSHKIDVQVAAIIDDLPDKSSLKGEMFCSTDLKIKYSRSGYNGKDYYLYKHFLKINSKSKPGELEKKISSAIDPYDMEWLKGEYMLQPFSEVYFDTSIPHDDLVHANVKLIRLLSWLALVILLLAVFNYINLSLAQSTRRLRELGIKQVFGAERLHLVSEFLHEASYQVILALILSLILTIFLKPMLGEILGKEVQVTQIFHEPLTLMIVLGCTFVIVILSGLYPALSVLRFKPGQMLLKQVSGIRESFDIKKLLTIIQFAAVMALIVCLVTLIRQVRYVQQKDLGYNTERLVRIEVHPDIVENLPALLEEISRLASVESVCASYCTPGEIWNYSSDDGLSVSQLLSDRRFIHTFQLELVHGRNFFEGEQARVCLINQTMLEAIGGWDSVEHRRIFGSEVVGVIRDFHFKNLYEPIGNLQILNEKVVSHLTVRFHEGSISESMKSIQKIFKEYAPGFVFQYEFYDEWLDAMYKQEEKKTQSIRLLSIIAILLSCLGVLGMAEFSTRNRIREIGIRKVNGAGIFNILCLLNTDFLKWVAIGIVLGVPLGWHFMYRWLTGFAYRTSLDVWIFGLAAGISIVVAMLTISWHTWHAARANPVESLRHQ